MFEDEIRIVLMLAFLVAMLSLTVTRSRLFKEFRDWVDAKTVNDVNDDPSMWYELVKCPFCFSFWVTAVTYFVFHAMWLHIACSVDQVVLVYASVWGTACILSGMIIKLFEPGGTLND